MQHMRALTDHTCLVHGGREAEHAGEQKQGMCLLQLCCSIDLVVRCHTAAHDLAAHDLAAHAHHWCEVFNCRDQQRGAAVCQLQHPLTAPLAIRPSPDWWSCQLIPAGPLPAALQ